MSEEILCLLREYADNRIRIRCGTPEMRARVLTVLSDTLGVDIDHNFPRSTRYLHPPYACPQFLEIEIVRVARIGHEDAYRVSCCMYTRSAKTVPGEEFLALVSELEPDRFEIGDLSELLGGVCV